MRAAACKRKMGSRRGAALMELALVLTPTLLLLFGAIVFTNAVFAYNNVSWIARQASRWASVRGSSSGNPASASAIQTYARSRATGLVPAALTVTASFSPNNNPGGVVTVEVRYTVTPLVASLFGQSFVVRSTSAMTILQ